MVMPFTDKGEVDEDSLAREARFLLTEGVDGLSLGGSTGEGAVVSDAELLRALQVVSSVLAAEQSTKSPRPPLVAGIIRNSTLDSVRCGVAAAQVGADALLVTPPFYYGGSVKTNYRYFQEIAEATGLPIILYNVVPTNIISPDDFILLLEIENVVGIKQVDPVMHAETSALVAGNSKARIFSACDQMLYGTYVSGSSGAISALVTVAPRQCVAQWRAFLSGDQATASEIQRKLLPVVRTYQRKPYPGRVKALLNLQGRSVGAARRPNDMPSEDEQRRMRNALLEAGLTVV